MAFKLSKQQSTKRAEFVDKLNGLAADIDSAINDYNAAMEEPRAEVEKAIEAYNEMLAAAREFASDIATAIGEEISEKSDTWQESEKGQAAEEWRLTWEQLYMDDVEIDFPDELSFDEPEHASDLEAIEEDVAQAA